MKKNRIKISRQLEANDCGPACLHMIAGYFGRKCTLDEIKASCEMTRLGISMRDIKNCAKLIGLETYIVRITPQELRRMPCPAILYFRHGHFVVLESIKDTPRGISYRIIDPEYGRMKMTEDGMESNLFSGNLGLAALFADNGEYSGVSELISPPEKKGMLKEALLKIFRPFTGKLGVIALLSLVTLAANWAMPLLLKTTIDDGIMNKDIGIVWLMLMAQFAFFIGFTVTNTVSTFVSTKTGLKISIKFISNYFDKIIRLPIAFFDSGLRTDLIRKLSDLTRIQAFATGNLMSIALACLNFIVFSCLLLYYNPNIFLIFIVFSAISYVYNHYFVKKRKYLDYASFSIESERSNLIHEMVTGMHEIKLNNAQNARIKQWEKLENKSNMLKIKQLYLDNFITNGSGLFSRLRDITLTGLCAFLVITDEMSMGVMMMVSFLLGQLASPINTLIEFTKSFQDVKLSYNRLERRERIGGNCSDEIMEGINVHRHGPHIFHTSDRRVWNFVNKFTEFNHFRYCPLARFGDRLYNLPFSMHTFYQLYGAMTPGEAREILDKEKCGIPNPANLEEKAISLVGIRLFDTLIKGYTEKQWGRSCRELSPDIITRLPVRFTYDNNYFNDPYQGIPVKGYTRMTENLLTGIEVRTCVDFLKERSYWRTVADKILYTGAIDEFFDYKYGALEYRSLRWEHNLYECPDKQGIAVINHTDASVPFTRTIEHKHFDFGRQPVTIVSKEFPETWSPGKEPYYPVNNARTGQIYERYRDLEGV